MDKLNAELQRLYFLPGQLGCSQKSGDSGSPSHPAAGLVTLDLVGSDGRARAMVVGFERAADWEQVAKLYQGVQEDLDLPAPAISVSGSDGYQMWFSLAEPVPVEQARVFLDALRRKYLAEIPVANLKCCPDAGESASAGRCQVPLVPALHMATGKWSAFIDPAMGSMFVEEPWLEMAPNSDKQADMLAKCESIKAGDIERVLSALALDPEPDYGHSERPANLPKEAAGRVRSRLNVGGNFSDPKSFLLAVMNDPSASARQRIEAAKALLPYFDSVAPK